jgi:hypothetical protein
MLIDKFLFIDTKSVIWLGILGLSDLIRGISYKFAILGKGTL